MSRPFQVVVRRLPAWLDCGRLLGPGDWQISEDGEYLEASAGLTREAAADLAARLRRVGIGGSLIDLQISPPLHRKDLRKASTDEARRYRDGSVGFSRPGVRLDREGKVSLTPEALALELGGRAAGMRVIDAFAGVGGNAIGFARAGCTVTAFELDSSRLAMARHNASVYGVSDRIEFIGGDARMLVGEHAADLLFLDPPWGERYNKERVTLPDLPPCADVLETAAHIPKKWIKVPPSFDPSTLTNCQTEAFFGVGSGDERRVKFLLLEIS
jgi:hypothetical protein